MDGLDLANRLFGATTRDALLDAPARRAGQRCAAGAEADRRRGGAGPGDGAAPVGRLAHRARCPTPPDLEPHVLRNVPLTHIYPYLNLQMLSGKHLGVKGSVARLLEQGDAKARRAAARSSSSSKREAVGQGLIRADGLYRFYEAHAAGDDLVLSDGGARDRALPLPAAARRRAAVPVRLRAREASGEQDYVALFAVTCGTGVRDLAERWKEAGDYLRSHALQALAIECAEAFAEMLHARLRTQWGFPDPPGAAARRQAQGATTAASACRSAIRPVRSSADQRILFDLLRPEQIGPRPHRGLHDGSRGVGLRARVPPPRGQVLQGRASRPPPERMPSLHARAQRRQRPLPRLSSRRSRSREAASSTSAAASGRALARPRAGLRRGSSAWTAIRP